MCEDVNRLAVVETAEWMGSFWDWMHDTSTVMSGQYGNRHIIRHCLCRHSFASAVQIVIKSRLLEFELA